MEIRYLLFRLMGGVVDKIKRRFLTRSIEVAVIGLENSGKTTLCNQLCLNQGGNPTPTIGLNVRVVKKNRVTFKIWDIGGQQNYHCQWQKYCEGADVILVVVDVHDASKVPTLKRVLHQVLDFEGIRSIPILVLANKIDLGASITEVELIQGLNLDYITEQAWMVQPISAKLGTNIEHAVDFLIQNSH